MHVARVQTPVRVREMLGCRIGAVSQESLEIKAKVIALASLRNCDATESDLTLTGGIYWSWPCRL